jgi:hypothetical protein
MGETKIHELAWYFYPPHKVLVGQKTGTLSTQLTMMIQHAA